MGDFRGGVFAQAAGRIHGGFAGAGEREGKGERDLGGSGAWNRDPGGGGVNEFLAGATTVCAAAGGGRYSVCGGDGSAAGSEPAPELAHGGAGVYRRGHLYDNEALISCLTQCFQPGQGMNPAATF